MWYYLKMVKKVLSDVQAAKLMYAIDSMDEYYRRELIGIPSRIRVKKILHELGNVKNKKILDVGCEAGHISMKVAEAGGRVTAVDLIDEPLEKFREILITKPHLKKRITIQKADARKLPFKNHQFDLIIAAEVIEHIRNLSGFISGVHKALKASGKLLITFPNEPLREKFYPLLTLFGINANIEGQITLKNYSANEVLNEFSGKFRLLKHYLLPWWCPVTHLMIFAPKQ